MKQILHIIILIVACSTSVNIAMKKEQLKKFENEVKRTVSCTCLFEILHSYKECYETLQQSLEKGLISPNTPEWFIVKAHASLVLKKHHPESYHIFVRNLPLAQGDISKKTFKSKVHSIFHPLVLSIFSIQFQQYLIQKRYDLLKLQNIADFNTLTAEEKNMFTVALLNLNHKKLKKECDTQLAQIIPYYEILKQHTEKICKLRMEQREQERQQID